MFSSQDPPPAVSVDAVLITKVRNSDPLALTELVQRYGTVLLRYATRLTGAVEVAEEIVQEVFFDLWQSRETLDPNWDLAAYLFGKTRQRALGTIRSEQRTARRNQDWTAATIAITEATNTAEQQLEADELRAELWKALGGVPPRCREIFLMVWDRHLPYAEVARELGIGVPTVKNQMSRAVKHLAQWFEEYQRRM